VPELPVNTLIIVILAVIVLLGILALFSGVWNPSSTGLSLEAAKSNACQLLASMGCNGDTSSIVVNNFDANKDGAIVGGSAFNTANWADPKNCNADATSQDNLAALCACYYGKKTDEPSCKSLCGCT
jgi:hypothetical protein